MKKWKKLKLEKIDKHLNRRGSNGRIVGFTYRSSLSFLTEFPPLDGFPLIATSSVSKTSVAPPVYSKPNKGTTQNSTYFSRE